MYNSKGEDIDDAVVNTLSKNITDEDVVKYIDTLLEYFRKRHPDELIETDIKDWSWGWILEYGFKFDINSIPKLKNIASGFFPVYFMRQPYFEDPYLVKATDSDAFEVFGSFVSRIIKNKPTFNNTLKNMIKEKNKKIREDLEKNLVQKAKEFDVFDWRDKDTTERVEREKKKADKEVDDVFDNDIKNFEAVLAKEKTDWTTNFDNVIAKELESKLKESYKPKEAKAKEKNDKAIEDEKLKIAKEIEDEKTKSAKEIENKQNEETINTQNQEILDTKEIEQLAVQAIENFKNQLAKETRTRCSKTAPKQNALESKKRIIKDVEEEYNDEDENEDEEETVSGGNISDMMYLINKKYIMNSPIESPYKKTGNASKKVKKYKIIGGRVRPVKTGLASIAIDVADLVIDLWGPQIKKFFEDLWASISNAFTETARDRADKREREKQAKKAELKLMIERIIAIYKGELVIEADKVFDEVSAEIEANFDADFDAYQDMMYDRLYEKLDEIEDKLIDDLEALEDSNISKIDELQNKKEKDLDDLENEKESKMSEIEQLEAKKREERKQELLNQKQAELSAQNQFYVIPKSTASMTTQQQNKIRHEAVQQEKAKEELKEQGVVAEGAGKKNNKRAQIVKNIMAKKGLSMIEASKYVKSNNLY